MDNLSTIKRRSKAPAREPYKPQNFERLIGMPGFSDRLLKDHFKLYEGYVKNTNALLEEFARADAESQHEPRFAEMHRRFGWEFNGMRLHEYYFGNLGWDGHMLEREAVFPKRIENEFGSFEDWKQKFTGMGLMRGIGWVVLAYDILSDRLLNVWIDQHDAGHLAGADPLLVMDVFEHAFLADYGLEKDKYITAFWNTVDWSEVQRRFEQAKGG